MTFCMCLGGKASWNFIEQKLAAVPNQREKWWENPLGWGPLSKQPPYTPYIVGIDWVYPFLKGLLI